MLRKTGLMLAAAGTVMAAAGLAASPAAAAPGVITVGGKHGHGHQAHRRHGHGHYAPPWARRWHPHRHGHWKHHRHGPRHGYGRYWHGKRCHWTRRPVTMRVWGPYGWSFETIWRPVRICY
ncbi:MAG: hypothetical protein Kow0032_01940 [Methyloligellaceae bacterium]